MLNIVVADTCLTLWVIMLQWYQNISIVGAIAVNVVVDITCDIAVTVVVVVVIAVVAVVAVCEWWDRSGAQSLGKVRGERCSQHCYRVDLAKERGEKTSQSCCRVALAKERGEKSTQSCYRGLRWTKYARRVRNSEQKIEWEYRCCCYRRANEREDGLYVCSGENREEPEWQNWKCGERLLTVE